MKPTIKDFVEMCSKNLPIKEPIYEFGSLQVEGQEGFSDLRPFFPNMKYVGADIRKGTGVDVILDIHKMSLPDESVGTVICCETLEHIEFPRKAIDEIYRILVPGGTAIISSQMFSPIHNYPNDYWRFTPEGFRSLLSKFESIYVDWDGQPANPHTVVGVGIKAPLDIKLDGNWKRLADPTTKLKMKMKQFISGRKFRN